MRSFFFYSRLHRLLFGLLACALFGSLASCVPVYVPSPPSAPLLLDKGDLSVSGNMSTSTLANLSVAYAFFDNFSVLAEVSLDPEMTSDDDHQFFGTNAALGYGGALGGDFRADVYLGGGFGSSQAVGNDGFLFGDGGTIRRTARFTNLLGQIDIGVVHRSIEAAYQLRGNYLMFNRYHKIRENLGMQGNLLSLDVASGHENNLFLEHSFVFRFGSEDMKGLCFLNMSLHPDSKDEDRETIHMPVSIGFGLHFRFNAFGYEKRYY